MQEDKLKLQKGSLIATLLFAVAAAIYGFLFISDFGKGSTGRDLLRGCLSVLFVILAIINYVKYRKASS
jgi:hypothetical protein